MRGRSRSRTTDRRGPSMRIGIIGAGTIGATLGRRLAAAGHEVAIANSRGPRTVDPEALSTGARAVDVAAAPEGAEVLIVSVPFGRLPDVAPVVRTAADSAVLIDTSNYFPHRDGVIAGLDGEVPESVRVCEILDRRVVKAWNAITSQSFRDRATGAGDPQRLAIPVAADDPTEGAIGRRLVEETGFTGLDAGPLRESWRQQPGSPAYCTDLDPAELSRALAAADADSAPRRRDLMIAVLDERRAAGDAVDGEYLVRLGRALF
ncbi:NADPH-dependent F420 reductase [Rathayibacter sp. Leaf296]|uniref:NADPH-dependent F420 reductase n=1 Tax=Rathayibacter sp. Leaf296 TaxID=1736327 RepID=UPI002285DF75|nr:NAD(P)-binding domain-containing protein [Rathayibacter sp. Leaf296]